MIKGYLSIKELVEYTSLSESTLRDLIKSGDIPSMRIKRKILVKVTDFDYWARRKKRERQYVDPVAQRIYNEIMGAA
ncbi:MAG: helix-turn-helix domain-containing protein [Acidobacteria bacterium]|nr:helix-turn-helix domain-containing protein [Acidobacteriota bacterium]